MMSARGTRGEKIGRNDGCRRVHDLRDSRIKRAFPPRCSPGLILADTLSTGFIRVNVKTSIVPFFSTYTLALRNICGTQIMLSSFLLPSQDDIYLSFVWSLGCFLPEVPLSADLEHCYLRKILILLLYFKIRVYSVVFLCGSIYSCIMQLIAERDVLRNPYVIDKFVADR